MNELFDARAKLARLKRRELELVEELLDVHKAVAAQKLVIDELIKASTIPLINRLPNELLAQIFLLIRSEREKLVHVSRRWRAVVFDTPSIWNEIILGCYEGRPGLLKLHLERSRQTPLTVTLDSDQQPELDVVLLHASRIRFLLIFGGAQHIIDRLASFTFPALEFLLLHGSYDRPLPSGPAAGQLSTSAPRTTCLSNIPVQSLIHLSLEGPMDSWRLPPDSIHFPVLESLKLRTDYPMSLLEAIAFDGPTSKFDNVRHIVFAASPSRDVARHGAFHLAQEFCYVFPGVRHAKIHMQYLRPLFYPCQTVGHPHIPIDNWTRLETLEIQDLDVNEVDVYFVSWFRMRKDLGLHLKLTSERHTANHSFVAPGAFKPGLYQTFQECCASVELCCVPVSSPMYLSLSADSSHLFTCPLGRYNQVNPTDLVALARRCSTEPADVLRAQLWTL
ncbi:hypothetical protein BKA83DRAFT_4489770 [Pisolithus microcarpus]|nr:hypothetical protein BKA83DRAFT_4489770 [Pisolithus microcarpus]